jgi:pimeloyl-ACP methyl ester carboxylesterase
MVIEERIIQEIPVLVGFEPSGPDRPLKILSHGFTRSREDWRDRIPKLVARGYFAAALDNRGHGQRNRPGFLTRANRDGTWEVLEIRKLIDETAEDIRAVIDGILRVETVDGARIGVAGVSMGAFASLKATVLDPRVRAVVSNIGSPFWDDEFPGTIEENDPDRRRILQDFAAGHQPAAFPERFFPRAVLFQTGGVDPHLDPRRVSEFARRLGDSYAGHLEREQCIEYPGIAHEFTPEMWAKALGWFERFL